MTVEQAFLGIEIITAIMMVAIILVYTCSIVFTVAFLIKAEWQAYYSHMYLFTAFASLGICAVFVFLLIKLIMGDPVEISFYGGMIIRPFVFLVGAATAGNAKLRLKMLLRGGAPWKLRK